MYMHSYRLYLHVPDFVGRYCEPCKTSAHWHSQIYEEFIRLGLVCWTWDILQNNFWPWNFCPVPWLNFPWNSIWRFKPKVSHKEPDPKSSPGKSLPVTCGSSQVHVIPSAGILPYVKQSKNAWLSWTVFCGVRIFILLLYHPACFTSPTSHGTFFQRAGTKMILLQITWDRKRMECKEKEELDKLEWLVLKKVVVDTWLSFSQVCPPVSK